MTPEDLKRLRENLHKSQNKILSPKLDIFTENNSKDENNKKVLEAVKTNKLKFKFLPPLLSYTMQALKEVNNVPEEMAIQAILGTVNFATQNLYNVDPIFFGGSIIPTTDYFIALAPTAGMKSTIYKMLDRGIKRFEEDEKIRYGNEIQNYKLAIAVWNKEYDKLMRSMKAEDLQDKQRFEGLVNSLGTEPQKPVSFKYRLSTGTRNGLIEFLDNVPFGGMSSSEAGEFFNGHTFQDGKNNSKGFEMITTLTNLWDGAPIEKVTGIESKYIKDRRFTMLFLLQKAMAKDWLGNKIYSEQGFVHRLLITHTDYWDVPELDRNRKAQIQSSQNKLGLFHDRIYELLSQKKSYYEDSKLELNLPTISMTDEACDKLAEFDNLIKREQTTTYSEWQGFVSRLYEHSVRLAATVAIFEGSTNIELRHAECAVELAFFYLEQRISLDLGASTKYANQVSVAEKLAGKILEKLDVGVVIDKDWLNKKSPMYFRGLSVDERRKIIDEIKSRGEITFVDLNGKDVAKRVV
jgi:hypothetical protein